MALKKPVRRLLKRINLLETLNYNLEVLVGSLQNEKISLRVIVATQDNIITSQKARIKQLEGQQHD